MAANPREGSRLLRFWVKPPNTNSEIGATHLSRARARQDCAPPPSQRGVSCKSTTRPLTSAIDTLLDEARQRSLKLDKNQKLKLGAA
jgi:hypothetical protein